MRVKVTELTPSQKAELDALMDLPDEEIDTSDIPEILEWRNPRRGLFADSPSRKAERLEISGKSGNVAPAEENLSDQGDENQMDKAQHQHTLEFIRELGLTSGQYTKKERPGGYSLFVPSGSSRFGYVRINDEGTMVVVVSNGDFSDPEGRFSAQPGNRYASYKFWPTNRDAMRYAAKVVKSAYKSKA